MTQEELAIVKAAREYVQQKRRGLYRTLPDYFEQLAKTVDALDEEWDGEQEQARQEWWAQQNQDDEWIAAHDGQ